MKLYKIRNGLYQRGRFSKFSKAEKLKMLKRYDIGMVVNMLSIKDPDLMDVAGLKYVCRPIPDSPNFSHHTVEDAAFMAIAQLRTGRGVLIHCNGGRNRSSLVTAIVLMDLYKMSAKEAIAKMREIRPNALATKAFTDYLKGRK